MTRNHKQYTFIPRWNIEVELTTTSFLHIGSNDIAYRDSLVVEQEDGSTNAADISACIKSSDGTPYIPGSTVKGNIRQWLQAHLADSDEAAGLANRLFGCPALGEEQGRGGAAEFHNGILTHPLMDCIQLPYWDSALQTCVETSTVMDRATGTVVEKKLFYREVVPPEVGFKLTVTGAMSLREVALLSAAIKRGFAEDCRNPVTLGAETSNGRGRLKLESLQMSILDEQQVREWIKGGSDNMVAEAMRSLSHAEVEERVEAGRVFMVDSSQTPHHIGIDLQFSGPFLVNDPSRSLNNEKGDPVHNPLRDTKGNPRLPAASFRGALRSQAEKIIRTLGGHCCDPANPCPAVYTVEEANDALCPACRLFGATGWKSRISIKKVRFTGAKQASDGSLEHKQDFVAIDRFHGGGKDTAKFKAAFALQPSYSIDLALAQDCSQWEMGLLALTLRDLKEGDIFFGFGRARGYGRINPEQTRLSGHEFLQDAAHIAALQELCREKGREYPCISRPVSRRKESPTRQAVAKGAPAGQQFHNPYHFVPIRKPETNTWLCKDDFGPAMHDSHALYRECDNEGAPVYHGRINCTLTTRTPTFIGGRRNGGQPEKVDHYREGGNVAIPAATLRGCLSSLAEAASNSSMRVLDDTLLSYRQPVGSRDNLSAIGMVIVRNGDYFLYPLVLPTFDQKQGLPGEYRSMFPTKTGDPARLKVYLENAYQTGAMKNFLDDKQSFSLQNPKIYYLPVPEFHFNTQGRVQGQHMRILKRKTTQKIDLLFGAHLEGNPCPVGHRERGDYVPGILRILGKEGRDDDIPRTKKHELFIPVSDDFAENPIEFIDTVPPDMLFEIPASVVAVFEELADQRTKPQIKHPEDITETKWLPYHLKGTSRNNGLTGESAHKLRIQQGDLVYFRPFPQARKVAEISFSSIWRSRVNKKVHKFFPPELRPFNMDREVISPAELLFGFVQQDEKNENNPKKKKLSFAGKVQMTSARVDQEQTMVFMDNATTLKILASPKPPTPSLYFKANTYVAKTAMNGGSVEPQGRKQYLHALPDANDSQGVQKLNRFGRADSSGHYPWESRHNQDSLQQKVRITPLKKGISFSFAVEFENCTAWELGLLLYIIRPTNEYRHKIGMGKPLGLGTVRIDVDELQFVNRKQRYSMDSLTTERYNQTIVQSTDELRALFAETMEPDIRDALELLGSPGNVQFPVHYPQVKEQDIEKETFSWFVDNDKQRHEYLEPLPSDSGQLPVLSRKDKLQ